MERPHHRIERVGDADHERFRRVFAQAGAHLLHDFEVDLDEVVAAHAGLAGDTGGDDHHIGVFDIGVFVGALESRREAFDRRRLRKIERFALRDAVHDVEEDDFAKFPDTSQVSKRAANLASTDQCNLITRHNFPSRFLRFRLPLRYFSGRYHSD